MNIVAPETFSKDTHLKKSKREFSFRGPGGKYEREDSVVRLNKTRADLLLLHPKANNKTDLTVPAKCSLSVSLNNT